MTTPATTPADGMTLDANEVQFLAARLRRLFNHFKYPLPRWAKDDKHLIGIAPTCIGAVLANLNRADEQRLAKGVLDDLASKGFAAEGASRNSVTHLATPSPGKAPEPEAWRIDIPDEPELGHWLAEDPMPDGDGYRSIPLYASPGKAEAEDAARFRWLLDGNGFFMEAMGLCGYPPCSDQEKDDARKEIDAAIQQNK